MGSTCFTVIAGYRVLSRSSVSPVQEDKVVKNMGTAARSHVMKTFSRTAFGNKLHALVSDLCKHRQSM